MNTYFIRHGSGLDVDRETLIHLCDSEYAGIHYPHDKNGKLPERDNESLDPNDYGKGAKGPMERLVTLAREGGYVFTTYHGIPGARVGLVEPNTKIKIIRGTWGNKYNLSGREAVLKMLPLAGVLELGPIDSLSFTTVQPRHGAIQKWNMIESRVADAYHRRHVQEVNALTPDLQEVICMEFLRTESAREAGLPVLATTLAPIGRTMAAVDIYGLSETGERIVAQVTFHNLEGSISKGKLGKLDAYAADGASTILFCNCEEPSWEGKHRVYPLSWVFDAFRMQPSGKAWLDAVSPRFEQIPQ